MNLYEEQTHYEVVDEVPVEQTPQNDLEERFKAPENPKSSLGLMVLIFVMGYFGLTFVAVIYQLIVKNVSLANGMTLEKVAELLSSIPQLSLTNFIRYSVTLAIMLVMLFIGKALIPILSHFKKLRTYLYGIGFGFLAIFLSVAYNLLVGLIFKDYGSNQNQNLVEEVIKLNPLLSLLWIPFFGPIVEEFTYRFGLFGSLKKINRTVAYVVTGLFFGLIHFNFPTAGDPNYNRQLLIEIVNLPSYILSGLLFNYIYEKENLGTSIVAHVTNNFVSYIASIITIFNQ